MTFFQKGKSRARSNSQAKSAVTFFTAVAFFGGFLTLAILPTPYLLERPGPTYDVLGEVAGEPVISISGAPSYDSQGMLDVLTVSIVGSRERTPNWVELAFAW